MFGILRQIQGWAKIKGDTDGTFIGNNNDCMKVAPCFAPVIPESDVRHKPEYLKDGSNRSMDVNGSSTAREFVWTVPGGETWYLDRISVFLLDPGSMDYRDFGSISGGLSTGLLVEVQSKGTTYEYANLQDNVDLWNFFHEGSPFAMGAGEDGSSGFFDEEDVFHRHIAFSSPWKLEAGDFVKATVRDNLTPLTEMTMMAHKWEVI